MDLVGGCEFFLHDLVGEEERSVLWGKRGNSEGRGRWWWWGTSGADEDTWHSFSVQATCRHGSLMDRPRQRSGPSGGEGYITYCSVQKLLPLLQLPKLIFQASKNSTNFCVDTRNQELSILIRIGRKAIVDLK